MVGFFQIVRRNLSPLAWSLLVPLCLIAIHYIRGIDNSAQYVAKGQSLLAMQQWSAAERMFQAVVEMAPDDHVAWSGLATALRELKKFDEAADAHRRALSLFPYHVDYVITFADTLCAAGRYRDARIELQKLRQRNYARSDRPNEVTARLVNICHQLNERPLALELLDEDLRKSPKDATLLRLRGDTYLLMGATESALSDLEAAARSAPNDATIIAHLNAARTRVR